MDQIVPPRPLFMKNICVKFVSLLVVLSSFSTFAFTQKIKISHATQSTCSFEGARIQSHIVRYNHKIEDISFTCLNEEVFEENGTLHRVLTFEFEVKSEEYLFHSKSQYFVNANLPKGIFTTLSSCLNELESGKIEFRNIHGFDSEYSACKKQQRSSHPVYILEVGSFRKSPWEFFAIDFTQNYLTDEGLTEPQILHLKNSLLANKGVLALETPQALFYYAKEKIHFSLDRILSSLNENVCIQQIERAQSLFKQISDDEPFLICLKKSNGYTEMQGLRKSFLIDSRDWGLGSEAYQSFELCLRMADQLFRKKKRDNPFLLGMLCRESMDDSSIFVIESFSKL